ncbi:MAG TPA: PDR/VanB family oxidoreductase [Burkholderiaceae bacterium]|nr:PDR/VanB family oxidoreductase [Burkholderiaceae bacterium]
MAATPQLLSLGVAEARMLNPLIRQLRLVAQDGGVLPGFTAGAHLRVQVTLPLGATDWRHYSLIDFSTLPGATEAPREYVIAVRREDDGRGGSRFMHERVQAGDVLTIEAPKNEFALRDLDSRAVLIAGGIGITPLTSMAAQRKAQGRAVRMHYAGRSRSLMAFLPELQQLLGDDLRLHSDDEAGAPLDVDTLLEGCCADDQLYVCGPKVLLDAVLAKTQARGWTHERVHFELFTTPVAEAGDRAFEVVLAQSGKSFTVPAAQTVLDCLIEHGCDPMLDCKRGECGVCSTAVIEGDIDHRDYFLSDAEKASGKLMQICISRARGARLVLDL